LAGSLVVMLAALSASAATFKDGKGMFNRRLGMFIHWGIYSVGAWHEQEFWRKQMSRADYERYRDRFTAEKFSADRFIDVAESAGAEYIVITTKHHDGFCLWDTQTTDHKATNAPAKRDLIAELATACRRRGMKLGFYFSNPDWHVPFGNNPKSSHQIPLQPGDKPDTEKYVAYVKAQVAELCSNYGELCCFFWDIPTKIDRPEMDALVRRLQPGILIDDRGWGNKATCDYSTPERNYEIGIPSDKQVEACDSIGAQSWGYRQNEDYHTLGYLSRRIDGFLATGANFLLNVGPKADGTIAPEAEAIMRRVGDWYGRVRDSYRDVQTVTNLVNAKLGAVTTRRGNTLFVHLPKGLDACGVDLGLQTLPAKAMLLNDGRSLETEMEVFPSKGVGGKPSLHVKNVPADDFANETLVLRLDFEGEIR